MPNQEDISLVTNILKQIPLFAELDSSEHGEIISHINMQYFPKDYLIFNENDPGTALYIIKKGTVRIFHPGATESLNREVSILKDNDFFGEMALIEEKPRNASAKTLEDSEIFILSKEDFHKLISSNPNMATKISSEFMSRLKSNLRSDANS